ncbi:hypothetical protein E0500_023165 [Streptomyces sp. KM273126]|uniref:hypothetical protein n=1 Tax=Streptomyces sp. KM273126 TaxID=2545247 RepID=UPI0010395B12|nr:hypothetical protein [Streptomyces sp. KM273126]MBA2810217.1 hypothetical protein [Streptomyces sp. KM273126]
MSPGHVVPLITDQFQCQRLGTTDPLARKPNLDRLTADCVNRTNMFRSDPAVHTVAGVDPDRVCPQEADVMAIYGFGGHTGQPSPDRKTVGRAAVPGRTPNGAQGTWTTDRAHDTPQCSSPPVNFLTAAACAVGLLTGSLFVPLVKEDVDQVGARFGGSVV